MLEVMFTSTVDKRAKKKETKKQRISFSWSFQFQQETITIIPMTV